MQRVGRRRVLLMSALLAPTHLLLVCGAAHAHVEVVGRPVQGGQSDAVVRFHASAESTSAGIGAVEVALPAALEPDDVTWEEGPTGWHFQRTATGFLAAGPAPVPGMPVSYAVRLREVPERDLLVFPTTVIYADGQRVAWHDTPARSLVQPEGAAPALRPVLDSALGDGGRGTAALVAVTVLLVAGAYLSRGALRRRPAPRHAR